ncbi:four helix bundle protein [Peribacillus asahii]|uniref:four helix bundle protein n=1 Tax=Peribacillus asahii TaxID=228899 RepID=UPI002079C060|nr:four helix bundle protein [Peribacillus asahii]USK60396.1 four helix bundle protein [Peribacillus asahii]
MSLSFPKFELYEIGGQLRRATDAIQLNLCEGNEEIYPKTEIKHVDSAICSTNEVRAILDIILDRKYTTKEKHHELEQEIKEIQYILKAMMNSLYKNIKDELIPLLSESNRL